MYYSYLLIYLPINYDFNNTQNLKLWHKQHQMYVLHKLRLLTMYDNKRIPISQDHYIIGVRNYSQCKLLHLIFTLRYQASTIQTIFIQCNIQPFLSIPFDRSFVLFWHIVRHINPWQIYSDTLNSMIILYLITIFIQVYQWSYIKQ